MSIFVVAMMLAVPFSTVVGWDDSSDVIGLDTAGSEAPSVPTVTEPTTASIDGYKPADDSYTVKGFVTQSATEESSNVVNTRGLYEGDQFVTWKQNSANYRTAENFERLAYSSYGQPLIVEDLDINGKVRDVVFSTSSAYDAKTGEFLWTAPSNGLYQLKGPVYYNGVLFEQTSGGSPNFIAIDAYTGKILASYSLGGFGSTMTMSDDGMIYVGSSGGFNSGNGFVHCFDANLQKVGGKLTLNCIWSTQSPSGNGYYVDRCCVAGNYVAFCDNRSEVQIFDRFTGVLTDSIEFSPGYMTGVFYNKDINKLYPITDTTIFAYELDQTTGKLDRNTYSSFEAEKLSGVPTYHNGKLYIPDNKGLVCIDWSTMDFKWRLPGYGGNFILNTEKDDGDGEVYLYSTAAGKGGKSVIGLKDSNTMAIAEEVFSISSSTTDFVFTGVSLWDGGLYYTQDRGLLTGYVISDQPAWERPEPQSLPEGEMTVIVDSIKNIGVKKVSNADPALTVKDALKKTLDMIDPKMKAKWDDRGLVQFRFDANTEDRMWVYALWDDANSKWNFSKELTGNELAKDYSAIGLYYANIEGDKITVNSNSTPTNNIHFKTILFKDGNEHIWTHVCRDSTSWTADKALTVALGLANDSRFVVDPENPKTIKDGTYYEYSASGGYTGNWRLSSNYGNTYAMVWAYSVNGAPNMQIFDAYEPVRYTFEFDAGSVVFSQYWFADGVKYNEAISDILRFKGISCSMAPQPAFMGLESNEDYVWKFYVQEGKEWVALPDLDTVASKSFRAVYEPVSGVKDSGEPLNSTFLVENTVSPSMGWYSVKGAKLDALGEYVGAIVSVDESNPLPVKSIGDVANTEANIWNSWQWVNGGWAQVISLNGGSMNNIYALVYGPAGTMPSYLVDSPYVKDKAFSESSGAVTVTADVEPYAYYNSGVTSLTVQEGVKSIGAYAFYGTGITELVLPDSVTSIGAYAFYGCPLTTVTLGDKVYYIGESALGTDKSFLPKFQVKDLGEGLGEIYRYNGPGGEVTIPDNLGGLSIVAVTGGAFLDRADVTSVTLPATVSTIGTKAFSGTGITSMTLAADNMKIASEAFSNCTSLASVTFAGSVDLIGSYAFYNDSALASLTFEKGVKTFGSYAFSKTALTSFTLPAGITEVPMGLFDGTSTLTAVDLTGAVKIGDYAFNGARITALTIPATVTDIGDYSFYGNDIKNLVVPKAVKSIGDYAFFGNQAIEWVEFEGERENEMYIPMKAFALLSDRENVFIGWFTEPDGAGTKWDYRLSVDGGKFYSQIIAPPTEFNEIFEYNIKNGNVNITGLKVAMAYVTVPDYVVDGPNKYPIVSITGFQEMDSLIEIKLSKYIKTVGYNAFGNCVNLTTVEFGENIQNIGNSAFRGTALSGEVVLKGVVSIGDYAFAETDITSLKTGPNLTKIGMSAFMNCEKLTSVQFSPDSSIDIKNAFFGTSLKSIYIPDGSIINKGAFSGCSTLEMVYVGDNVKGVNMGSPFTNTNVMVIRMGTGINADGQGYAGSKNLSTVIIDSVGLFRHNAFWGTSNLTEIYYFCPGSATNMGTSHASTAAGNFTVYYLKEFEDTWVDAEGKSLVPGFAKQKLSVFNGIRFLMNDGTDKTFFLDDIKSPRVGVMLANDEPVREGYTFGGWFTEAGCSTPFDLSNFTEFNGGVLKVYAKWTPVEYNVKFDLDGGTYENAPTKYTYDGLELGTPVKEGVEFRGWYTSADFYGKPITKLPVYDKKDVTLYAAWSDSYFNPFFSYGATIEGSTLTKYMGDETDVTVPDNINGQILTTIGDNAFQSTDVVSVTLPDSVVRIGNYAFDSCANLERVYIGKNVASIGEGAFNNCPKLTEIVVAEGNSEVTFKDGVLICDRLLVYYMPSSGVKDIVIPDNVSKIGARAFMNAKIDTVTKTGGWMVNIGENAFSMSTVAHVLEAANENDIARIGNVEHHGFYKCDNIESIVLHPNCTEIAENAFSQCQKLKSVTLSRDLHEIGSYAFNYSRAIDTIDMSLCTDLWNIRYNAFAGTAITDVVLPESIRFIDSGVFSNCESLKSAYIPDGVGISRSMFYGCSALTDVRMPNDVDLGELRPWGGYNHIASSAFGYCTSLESIVLPKECTMIPDKMFAGCTALKSIVIPEKVVYLGRELFNGCTALESITIDGDITSSNSRVFRGIPAETVLNVTGTLGDEITSSMWSGFPETAKIHYIPGLSDSWNKETVPGVKEVMPITIDATATALGNQVSVTVNMWSKELPTLDLNVEAWIYAEFEGNAKDSSLFMRNITDAQLKDGKTTTVQFSCFAEPVKISVMLFTDDPANGGVMLSETTKTL